MPTISVDKYDLFEALGQKYVSAHTIPVAPFIHPHLQDDDAPPSIYRERDQWRVEY